MAATLTRCAHCEQETETFSYLGGLYEFAPARTRALVSDGREPVEVDDESVRASIAGRDFDEEHLGHVCRRPGRIGSRVRRAHP